MRVLSLCSGAGGLDLGLQRAGMTVVGHCEIDPTARQVLAHHWPDIPCWDDITTMNGHDWNGRTDLVCGGTPCTDLSVAGRREGLGGQHSRIFWDFCRIADKSNARWVLWENVAGALSSNRGGDFAAVLWGLTGHHPQVPPNGWKTSGVCVGLERAVVWRLLDARWFGVAQRRRRVFALACPTADIGRAVEILFEPESVSGNPPPGRQAGQAVAALTANGVGTCGADDNQAQAGHLIANTLTARDAKGPPTRIDSGQGNLIYAPVGFLSENQWSELRLTDHAASLSSGGGKPGQGYPAVAIAMRGRTDGDQPELGEPDIYNALRAGDGGSSRQNGVLTPGLAVRRLTPIECERLMSWPDGWTSHTTDGRQIADSHRYRMCGNGVVSNVTEWIGRRILQQTEDDQ